MPITHRIDHSLKIVFAAGIGVMTDADAFGYQNEVWSRKDIEGFSEFIDMTAVERIALPSTERVRDLAALSARMDVGPGPAKLAVVAPDDYAFALGRMFQAHRELDRGSRKEVGIFRTHREAAAFLGLPEETVAAAAAELVARVASSS